MVNNNNNKVDIITPRDLKLSSIGCLGLNLSPPIVVTIKFNSQYFHLDHTLFIGLTRCQHSLKIIKN